MCEETPKTTVEQNANPSIILHPLFTCLQIQNDIVHSLTETCVYGFFVLFCFLKKNQFHYFYIVFKKASCMSSRKLHRTQQKLIHVVQMLKSILK